MSTYIFRLAGHLDRRWERAFDGFTLSHRFDQAQRPVTLMAGAVADQSALYGVLGRLRDLGVTLISVCPAEPGPAEPPRSAE